MPNTARFALSVMCQDSVGLVARLTDSVCRLDGEIEVLHQGVLQGYFVFMLLAAFPEGTQAKALEQAIESAAPAGEFVVSVMPRSEKVVAPPQSGASFILTVFGQREDVAPVLRKTTSYLSDHRINIEGLTCEPIQGKSVITERLTIPASVDIHTLRLDLNEILKADEVNISLVHEDIFAATSHIEMPRHHR